MFDPLPAPSYKVTIINNLADEKWLDEGKNPTKMLIFSEFVCPYHSVLRLRDYIHESVRHIS
jgi:hypothetical protein